MSRADGLADASSVESSDVCVASFVSSVSADAGSVALDSGSEASSSALTATAALHSAASQPCADSSDTSLGSFALSPPSKKSGSAASVSEAFADLVAAGVSAGGTGSFASSAVPACEPSFDLSDTSSVASALSPPS